MCGLAAQLLGLLADRLAAEDGDDADAGRLAEGAHRLRDLDRELARRDEDDRLHVLAGGIDVVDRGQAERGGLAGAGLGLPDHVASARHEGDGQGLDGRRLGIAERLDGCQHARWTVRVRKIRTRAR